MEHKEINSLIVEKYGELPYYSKRPMPVPKKGELLVKVEASTINPVDNLIIEGSHFKRPLPLAPGYEGCGRVEKVKEYHFKDIKEALEASKTKATEGKVLLRP